MEWVNKHVSAREHYFKVPKCLLGPRYMTAEIMVICRHKLTVFKKSPLHKICKGRLIPNFRQHVCRVCLRHI